MPAIQYCHDFDPDDIIRDLPDDVTIVIADLILQWARMDGLVSQWVITVFGMRLDTGAILLGNMDTRAKLDRLKKLYAHHELSAAAEIGKLMKAHAEHVDVRNLVAHAACGGVRRSDPDRLIFAPVRAHQGKVGHMNVDLVHIEQIRAATSFACGAANDLMKLLAYLDERHTERAQAYQEGLAASEDRTAPKNG